VSELRHAHGDVPDECAERLVEVGAALGHEWWTV
jgi:hypothetical protein